jgi:hypothetical protein
MYFSYQKSDVKKRHRRVTIDMLVAIGNALQPVRLNEMIKQSEFTQPEKVSSTKSIAWDVLLN